MMKSPCTLDFDLHYHQLSRRPRAVILIPSSLPVLWIWIWIIISCHGDPELSSSSSSHLTSQYFGFGFGLSSAVTETQSCHPHPHPIFPPSTLDFDLHYHQLSLQPRAVILIPSYLPVLWIWSQIIISCYGDPELSSSSSSNLPSKYFGFGFRLSSAVTETQSCHPHPHPILPPSTLDLELDYHQLSLQPRAVILIPSSLPQILHPLLLKSNFVRFRLKRKTNNRG